MSKSDIKRKYWPTREWQAADPASVGMNPEKFMYLEDSLESQYRSINGIVVVRKGYIVFERYNDGAIRVENRSPGIRTAKHRLRMQRDWARYILNLLDRQGQPGRFQYSSAGPHLLSVIITRATGVCAREFANEHLFRPLGVKEIPDHDMKSFALDDVFGENVTGWIKDPTGNTVGGWGLTITPRDMARFGFLYLNRGIWDNTRIISRTWIDESTAENANGYGYLWWLKGTGDTFTFSAAGTGGSHIYCIPGKDLVVAIASKIARRPLDRWALLDKFIIPAIID